MRNIRILMTACALSVLSGPTFAEGDGGLIDNFGDWSAFKTKESGADVCYMGSVPTKEEGDYTKRGETFVLFSHRPAEGRLNELSVTAGYTHKKGGEVDVAIGTQSFSLFTDGDTAWAWDKETDLKVIKAMRGGKTMVVKGVSHRGTRTMDTYSLKGVTAAWKAINAACGVQ